MEPESKEAIEKSKETPKSPEKEAVAEEAPIEEDPKEESEEP